MKWTELLGILIWIGIIAGSIFFTKWIFESVMATDWPDWVKYVILR